MAFQKQRSLRQRKKNNTLVYCPGGRPVSMQNFRFIVHMVHLLLHGCGLHYNILSTSGLLVEQEVKGLMTSYIHVTMPVYSLVLYTVSEFRFFKNIMQCRTELNGLRKKLSFSILPT